MAKYTQDFKSARNQKVFKSEKPSDLTTRGTKRVTKRTGGKRESASLKYNDDYYNVRNLRKILSSGSEADIKALRAEYSRLRAIADKRMKALKRSDFKTHDTVYRYEDSIVYLKDIKDDRELAHLMSDLAHFIKLKSSSVKELTKSRSQTIKSLKDVGIDFVNKDNFNMFMRFMDEARRQKLLDIFDSERVAEIFREVDPGSESDIRAIFEHFEEFIKLNDSNYVKYDNPSKTVNISQIYG